MRGSTVMGKTKYIPRLKQEYKAKIMKDMMEEFATLFRVSQEL